MALAWKPDGTRLVSLYDDGLVKVWETANGHEVYTLRGLMENWPKVQGTGLLTWTEGGKQLLAADSGGHVLIWDMIKGKEVRYRTLFTPLQPEAPLNASLFALSPDGRLLAATSGGLGGGKKISIWDTGSGKQLTPLRANEGPSPPGAIQQPLVWGPDGQYLARGGADGTVKVWQLSAARRSMWTWRTKPASGVVWSSNGREIIAPGPEETIRFLDVLTGEVVRPLKSPEIPGPRAQVFQDPVSVVVSSPDSRQLASASKAGTIRVWEAGTGKVRLTLENPPPPPVGHRLESGRQASGGGHIQSNP